MIDYLNEYMTNTEFEYIKKKLDENIIELLSLNKDNIKKNLDYLKYLELNIFEIVLYRIDLLINNNEEIKQRFEKTIDFIKNVKIKDYGLLGI